MTHVVTFKLDSGLLQKLEAYARQKGQSRGASIRDALEAQLREKTDNFDLIRLATNGLLSGKLGKVRIDLEAIREKASQNIPKGLTAEMEVQMHRRRGM